jgi:hypothetical protein
MVSALLSLAIVYATTCVLAQAQDNKKYLQEKPVRRLALVVGNAAYTTATALPGNMTDAENMRNLLSDPKLPDDLRFDVTFAPDVETLRTFEELYLKPFLRKISPGDFVVFYFSGHGFSYGDENFLVPLIFPKQVKDTDLPDKFLSARSVHTLLLDRNPGALVSLLDACRNVANFITITTRSDEDKPDPDMQPKSLTAFKSPSGNIVIGFAAESGASAEGSSVRGKLSIYTQALIKNLPLPDTEFSTVVKEIDYDVKKASKDKQKPWISGSSSTEIHLRPTQVTLGQEQRLWKSYLERGDRDEIERFSKRHGISRYAAAARQWLRDNPVKATTTLEFTRISPAALELAWGQMTNLPTVQLDIFGKKLRNTVKLRSVTGPLAFPRIAKAEDRAAQSLETKDLVFSESGFPTMPTGRTVTDFAAMFAEYGKAIVSSRIGANAAPSASSTLVADIRPGTKIDVVGYSTDANNNAWVEVKLPSMAEVVFIPVPGQAKTSFIDVGKALLEVIVPGAKQGLRSAIDDKVVFDALAKLRTQKSSVERVSIAVPKTGDSDKADLYSERALYLIQLLRDAGIAADRISTTNVADIAGEDVRLRIFGN